MLNMEMDKLLSTYKKGVQLGFHMFYSCGDLQAWVDFNHENWEFLNTYEDVSF